jgi:hypothetical protein
MIDWVIAHQPAMTLYIYIGGRSCPARNPFTSRNSLGLLNSTRTRGPPVRSVKPTSQTGQAIAGSATGPPTGQTVQGHQSDQWRQPDRLCANFGCKDTSCFLVKLALKNNFKVDVALHRPFLSKGDFCFKSAISYQASCQTLG